MFIEEGLRREEEFELNPEQETRLLRRGSAQSRRGELIDGEAVMAKFEKALQKIASRSRRFGFTPDAELDMDEITGYLQGLPQDPALRIGRKLQQAITNITRFPGLGRIDQRLTILTRTKVLRLVSGQYILFYYVAEQSIRILGVINTKRDIDDIMNHRLK